VAKDFVAFLLSVKEQWRRLLTGSLIVALLGFTDRFRHIPSSAYWVVVCATLFWSFFGAWRVEYRRKCELEKALITEYVAAIGEIKKQASAGTIVFSSVDDVRTLCAGKIRGDAETLEKAYQQFFDTLTQNQTTRNASSVKKGRGMWKRH
jgi:hypothetical protein